MSFVQNVVVVVALTAINTGTYVVIRVIGIDYMNRLIPTGSRATALSIALTVWRATHHIPADKSIESLDLTPELVEDW